MTIQEDCIREIVDSYNKSKQNNTKFDNFKFVYNKIKSYYGGKKKKTKETDS